MKKLIFFLFVSTLISCNEKKLINNYVIFTGQIENIKGTSLSIRTIDGVIKQINVLDNGTFIDTIRNIEPSFFTFRYNNETSSMFLKPGDSLVLSLDTNEFDESIEYIGTGSNENNYLAKKFLNEEGLGKLVSYRYLGTLEENEYIRIADSIKYLEQNFFNEQKKMNPQFKVLEEASIKYSWVNRLDKYELYRRFVTEEKDFTVSTNYPDYTAGLDLEKESLIDLPDYRTYLKSYYRKKANYLHDEKEIDEDLTFLKTVSKSVKSSVIKEKLMYGAAKYAISYTKELQEYYDVFMDNSVNVEHKKLITSKYEKIIKLSKGQPSPKFNKYKNYNGGTTSLDELNGKYVYIDVWATWCGPCIREIPFLKEVEKKYQGKKITFVSLSIDADNDHDKWREMVKEKNLGGIQLFADSAGESKFIMDYEIQGIPRFILIDPNGNIVNANSPSPSSPELIQLFDELKI